MLLSFFHFDFGLKALREAGKDRYVMLNKGTPPYRLIYQISDTTGFVLPGFGLSIFTHRGCDAICGNAHGK